ncbi:MAG: peptidoglycan D,D-transpeptidase FtsI family protein [bacterium]
MRPALRRRTSWVLALTLASLGTLMLRLIDMQIRQGPRLRTLAAQQAIRIIDLPSQRGVIYDRRGRPLAVNVPARSIFADPSLIMNAAATAERLAPLVGVSAEDLRKRLISPRRFVWIARRADDEVAARVRALRLPGIRTVREDRRVYPSGPLAGAVLGFTGTDNQGLAGMELTYESVLAGRAGQMRLVIDALGRELTGTERVITPVRDGRSVLLTIDAVIQHIVERELTAAVRESAARRGIALVMDPRSGEMLAVATAPAFDPSRPDLHRPDRWRNPAISDLYEPGSTFKVILAAAALESGAIGAEERFAVPEALTVSGHTIREAEPHPDRPKVQTLSDMLTYSSNVGAAIVGARLGKTRMVLALDRFGFGRPTGIDLPGEAAGLVRPTREWYGPSLQTIGFGQGISVTPLQLLVAASALANNGVALRPRVARVIRSSEGGVEPVPPDPGRQVVSQKTAQAVMAMLRRAVAAGTGRKAAVEGYEVAGKTGTAEKPGPGGYARGKYVASFVGFAPVGAPRIAVLILLDEPQGRFYGGEVAAPVFARMASQILYRLGVPPKTAPRPSGQTSRQR